MALVYQNPAQDMMMAQMLGEMGYNIGNVAMPLADTVRKGVFGWSDPGFKGTQAEWNKDVYRKFYDKHIGPDPSLFAWGTNEDDKFANYKEFMETVDPTVRHDQGETFLDTSGHPDWDDDMSARFQRGGDLHTLMLDELHKGYTGTYKDKIRHQGLLGMPGEGKGLVPLFDKDGILHAGANALGQGYRGADTLLGGALPNFGQGLYNNLRDVQMEIATMRAEMPTLKTTDPDKYAQYAERVAQLQKKQARMKKTMEFGSYKGGPGYLEGLWGPEFKPFGGKTSSPLANLYYQDVNAWKKQTEKLASENPEVWDKDKKKFTNDLYSEDLTKDWATQPGYLGKDKFTDMGGKGWLGYGKKQWAPGKLTGMAAGAIGAGAYQGGKWAGQQGMNLGFGSKGGLGSRKEAGARANQIKTTMNEKIELYKSLDPQSQQAKDLQAEITTLNEEYNTFKLGLFHTPGERPGIIPGLLGKGVQGIRKGVQQGYADVDEGFFGGALPGGFDALDNAYQKYASTIPNPMTKEEFGKMYQPNAFKDGTGWPGTIGQAGRDIYGVGENIVSGIGEGIGAAGQFAQQVGGNIASKIKNFDVPFTQRDNWNRFSKGLDQMTPSKQAFDPTGKSPEEIKAYQQYLIDQGYNLGKTGADGDWGNKSINADARHLEEQFKTLPRNFKDYKKANPSPLRQLMDDVKEGRAKGKTAQKRNYQRSMHGINELLSSVQGTGKPNLAALTGRGGAKFLDMKTVNKLLSDEVITQEEANLLIQGGAVLGTGGAPEHQMRDGDYKQFIYGRGAPAANQITGNSVLDSFHGYNTNYED
tara:strand:+ start:18855 stop:21290 length:2436 start_codon:yes stop_codon:yes gene_type:complete